MSVVAGAPLSVREPGIADAGCKLSDMRCASSIRRRVHLSQPSHSSSSSSSSMLFTSKETVRTVRDGEPRTATSTFTQLLSSAAPSQFNVTLRPQRPYGLLGTGALEGRLDFHTAPELCQM